MAMAHIFAGAVATAHAEICPELLHIGVDGQRGGQAEYQARVAEAAHTGVVTIAEDAMETLVLGPAALLLTCPLCQRRRQGDRTMASCAQVSVLWMHQEDRWQTRFIHATTIQAPQEAVAEGIPNAPSGHILRFDAEAAREVAELTLAERKWEAINCERAAVEQLRRHDVAGARAALHPECIIVATDGSRQGRDSWLVLVADGRRSVDDTVFGPMQVIAVTPVAMLVVYSLEKRGIYDGALFVEVESRAALWLRWTGGWQCVFVQATPQAC